MNPPTAAAIDPMALPLRDIHLPPPPPWWPPAPGWWVLGLIAIGGPLLWLCWRTWRARTALRRAALAELSGLRTLADDPVRLAGAASMLLRRISLALDPTAAHVTVTGEAWLARLRALAPGLEDDTIAEPLLVAPYSGQAMTNASAFLAALEHWIRHLPPAPRRTSHV